ncbi:MAG: protein kinase [Thermoanaerobaculia bacterium]
MTIPAGTRLGPYEITAKIGEGGMGEVYLATDSRLKREVAIKVLPAAFTAEPERLARFEREAQLLAQLHHPHIASVFGLEEADGVRALVLELVQGPTLAERLAGGALPLEETLAIAQQIAQAFEAAHEKGIIHRDLKPQNVKLTTDGAVKVLDFGLAKALDPGSGSSSQADLGRSPTLMNSPTLTAAGTQLGVILGTAAYMAPEQARGGMVDKRADIWAFGVVLWEMLTGESMFAADTVSDTLAGVLRAEIDVTKLPPATPPALRRLLRRCLERNPRSRLHDIADARIVLDDLLAGRSDEAGAPAGGPAAVVLPAWRRALPWAIAALGLIAAAVGWRTGGANAPAAPLFVDLGAPEGERFQFQGDFGAPIVLSPDGKLVAFGAVGSDSKSRLWIRSLETGEQKRLDETVGATAPFFSPDGRSLGFFADSELKVVPVAGGSVYPVADAPNGRGGAWAPDGTIVFSPDFRTPLVRVPASGGKPQPMTTIDTTRHSSHRWPTLTPDGKAVVYLATNHAVDRASEFELRWVRLDGSDDHVLVASPANGVVVDGELLYLRGSSLLALAIDGSGRVRGEPKTVASELLYDPSTWRSTFAASGDRLILAAGGEKLGTHISRFDRSGRLLEDLTDDAVYFGIRLSPDGRRLAVARGLPSDIWLLDLDRRTQSRLTFDPLDEIRAVWSPDGRWIYYALNSLAGSTSGVGSRIVRKAANGSGAPELIFVPPEGIDVFPHDVSGDGRWMLVNTGVFPFLGDADLQWLALDGTKRLVPLLVTPAVEGDGRLSPDGRWVAYASNESGASQVYVTASGLGPESEVSGKWQISVDGGGHPNWSHDGKEIIYLERSLNLSRVEVAPDGAGGLRFGTPTPLFGTTLVADQSSFDIALDDQSLILNHFGEAQSRPLRMIDGWQRLLAR